MMLKYSALTQALEAWLNTGNQAPGTDEVLEFDPE